MSNTLLEAPAEQLAVPSEQTSYLAEHLAPRVLWLSGCTLADVLDGKQPIAEETVFFSPTGKKQELNLAKYLLGELAREVA